MLFSTLAENCTQFIRNGGGEVSERARAKWLPLGTNAIRPAVCTGMEDALIPYFESNRLLIFKLFFMGQFLLSQHFVDLQ